MRHNFKFGNVNDALPQLADRLLVEGDEFGSEKGRTMELMHVGITLDKPWQREIVLPSRKASLPAQIAETMWVLAGRNDVAFLHNYLPRATEFSDDGEVWRAGYGPRLRSWWNLPPGTRVATDKPVDQIGYCVDTLRRSPSSRQAVASIWDPTIDTTPGKDIPCNDWLNFSSRFGKLDLHVAIRSNDAIWGWSGINQFEWSALLEIVAGMCGLDVGSLHFAVTSFHLYDRHWAKARQLAQETGNFLYNDSPRFNATGLDDMESFDELCRQWFDVEHRIRTGLPHRDYVEMFPEPMLQSWLRVLQWWWTGEHEFLVPLRQTRLYEGAKASVQPKRGPAPVPCACGTLTVAADGSYRTELGGISHGLTPCYDTRDDFVGFVHNLHSEKHAAYGDSWKRRGEYMIMANVARKIDRLEGGADTPDETQTDTAIDLLVYLAKYDAWLAGSSGGPEDVLATLKGLAERLPEPQPVNAKVLVEDFGFLEKLTSIDQKRAALDTMLVEAYCLAFTRWAS